MRTLAVCILLLAVFSSLVSCYSTSEYREIVELEFCVEIKTPMKFSYYLCEDPIAYCYVSKKGGLSCFPKEVLDSEFEDANVIIPVLKP